MANCNIILAGFGGQGVLFAGKVLAYAGMMDGKQVSWLPSYGPEMRGGTANCSVCISDDPIGSPLVTTPDVLIVLNAPSYDKFIDTVAPGGVAIIDSTLISQRCSRADIDVFYVPATQLAQEKGMDGLANIILLGKMLAARSILSIEGVEKGISKSVSARKQHLVEKNLDAVKLGMSL